MTSHHGGGSDGSLELPSECKAHTLVFGGSSAACNPLVGIIDQDISLLTAYMLFLSCTYYLLFAKYADLICGHNVAAMFCSF